MTKSILFYISLFLFGATLTLATLTELFSPTEKVDRQTLSDGIALGQCFAAQDASVQFGIPLSPRVEHTCKSLETEYQDYLR
jgi:hypothetical protein